MLKYYIFIVSLGIFIVGLIVAGIIIAGSPLFQKDINLDSERISAFDNILTQIENYYSLNHKLPVSLNDLSTRGYAINIQDPETKRNYDYSIVSTYSYKLCTTFSTDNSKQETSADMYPVSQHSHKKGYDCITFKLPAFVINQSNSPSPTMNNTFPTSPTGSINGPTSGVVGQTLTYNVSLGDPGGDLSSGEIYWGTKTSGFKLFGSSKLSGSFGSFSANWIPTEPGTYYIMIIVSDIKGLLCTGNPFEQGALTYSPPTCGSGSNLSVTIRPSTTVTTTTSIQPQY